MKRNGYQLLLLVIAAMLVLAGCSGSAGTNGTNQGSGTSSTNTGETGTNTGTEPAGSSDKAVVQFWHSMGGNNGTYIDEMVAAYNSSQDKVEVVATFQGSYQEALTKVQQAVPAGTAPDIAMIERGFTPLLVEAEVLEDFTPWLESAGMSRDYFFEGFLGNTIFDDQFVALPFNRSTPMLHVNKTMLDEMGLKVPTNWDELAEVANALVIKENGEIKRYGYSMGYASWYPIAMLIQQGAGFYNEEKTGVGFDDELDIAFQYMKDLQKTGGLFYPPNTDAGNIISQMFFSGQVGMIMESTGLIGRFVGAEGVDFDYTAVFLPGKDSYGAPTGGANLVMFNESKQKEVAWDFLNWIFNDEKGAIDFIIKSGYVPVSSTMAESEAMQKAFEEVPARKNALDQMEYARDTSAHASFAELDQIFLKALEAIMYDDADIHTQVEKYREEAEAIMKQYE